MQLWKESLGKTNKKAAESLADPKQYENLFPQMKDSLVAEQYLKATEQPRPADHYLQVPVMQIVYSRVKQSFSYWFSGLV